MKKIPTIFERDWDGDRSRVVDQINPACQWVFDGEGYATQKIDGTCCMVRDGRLYKRREIKRGSDGAMPPEFEKVEADQTTGKMVGWVPVGDGPEDQYHREAFAAYPPHDWPNGTYELVGPKIQGNPEGEAVHALIAHDDDLRVFEPPQRDFASIRAWLAGKDMEGLVFHHPDGRMAKIKLRDFGLKRAKAT